jgi:putative DNA methylase
MSSSLVQTGMLAPGEMTSGWEEPQITLNSSPLRHLDVDGVSAAARRESRNRETVVPAVSVYRWWARRTDAVTGALLDVIGLDMKAPLLVCDPFAGGGAVALAAFRRGHAVYAQDINPWAAQGLATVVRLPSSEKVRAAALSLEAILAPSLKGAYCTRMSDGTPGVMSHTLRVMLGICPNCHYLQRLFPHALVSLTTRKDVVRDATTSAWAACPAGHLFRTTWPNESPLCCPTCHSRTDLSSGYTVGRQVTCAQCYQTDQLRRWLPRGPRWKIALVERTSQDGSWKELAEPSAVERRQADGYRWKPSRSLGMIPEGVELRVLRQHGLREWGRLFPRRQQVMLEQAISAAKSLDIDEQTKSAIVLAVTGATEMAGHLSRWDRYYLKSFEAMAGHRFNLPTLAVEPHIWGHRGAGRGGIGRRLSALEAAAAWWSDQHTLAGVAAPSVKLFLSDDCQQENSILVGGDDDPRLAVVCGDARRLLLNDGSVDAVVTDPPYHNDLNYHDLSLPLRAWAGLPTAELDGEIVGRSEKPERYRRLLTEAFTEIRRVLKPAGHLLLTYANRDLRAWSDLFQSFNDAGFFVQGVASVHAENETDASKRGRRSCCHDMVLDLTACRATSADEQCCILANSGNEAEIDFLQEVASVALRQGRGELENPLPMLTQRLGKHRFLRAPSLPDSFLPFGDLGTS